MISLVSLSMAYLLAVFIGARSDRAWASKYFLLAIITVVQVAIVVIAMFVMDPPVFKRFGE